MIEALNVKALLFFVLGTNARSTTNDRRLKASARRERLRLLSLVVAIEFEVDVVETWIREFGVGSVGARARSSLLLKRLLGGKPRLHFAPIRGAVAVACPGDLAVLMNPARPGSRSGTALL